MTKTYRALVQGLVSAETMDIECPIGPVAHAAAFGGSCGEVCAARPEGGPGCKAARSHLRVVRGKRGGKRRPVRLTEKSA